MILGIVYLTCHQRRIQYEAQLEKEAKERASKVKTEEPAVVLKKKKFDLKSEIKSHEKSWGDETTLLIQEEGNGSLMFDRELKRQESNQRL